MHIINNFLFEILFWLLMYSLVLVKLITIDLKSMSKQQQRTIHTYISIAT